MVCSTNLRLIFDFLYLTDTIDKDFHGMVRDSVALMTDDPLKVQDMNLNDDSPVPHPKQFVPFNEAWGETSSYGFGGTSLVETDHEAAEGAVFYVVVGPLLKLQEDFS